MITERFTRNRNKVEVLKWVIARMQPNGIRDKREDAPQNSAITISWQGNDVAVSAADDSQAPVNIGADCGYRPRLRSDRPVFKAPLTPPPPDAAAATFAIRPDYKPHTRRASMEIKIPYAPRALQAQLHAEMQVRRWGVVVCHRRFGKTVWAINHILRDALMSSKPAPWYATMALMCRQAKSVSWDFLNGLNIKLEKRVVSMCRND